MSYDASSLYSDAYSIEYNWERWLPRNVHYYHDLVRRECNTPIDLQMGVMLPFISALCGPTTKALYSTRSSCINLYWLNVAASGVGKTQSRLRFISEPMSYICDNTDESVQDFIVSSFTRAGIQDKIISTSGYCCIVTDEGSTFFDDLKKKETKHESDLGLLNQLYDGYGDKTTLAQSKERIVPCNSTCLSVSLQPEPFISGLQSLGMSLWNYNGFGERFLITSVRPFKFMSHVNNTASKELNENYSKDFFGDICLEIFNLHRDSKRCYVLDSEAKELYESIVDKYSAQFNLKYSNEPLTASQPKLDNMEKADITVRTKARELIGRLSVVLWIYCQAFQCVRNNRRFDIGLEVRKEFVQYAEEIVSTSYAQSETFSSAVLSKWSGAAQGIVKPKMTDRSRVICYLTKTAGPVAYVRLAAKSIRSMTTELVNDELSKLVSEGYGRLISKEKMHQDKTLPYKSCANVYMKPEPSTIDQKFFQMCQDKDMTEGLYLANFNKPIDDLRKTMVVKYHPHRHLMFISQMSSGMDISTELSYEQKMPKKSNLVFVIGKGMVQKELANDDHLNESPVIGCAQKKVDVNNNDDKVDYSEELFDTEESSKEQRKIHKDDKIMSKKFDRTVLDSGAGTSKTPVFSTDDSSDGKVKFVPPEYKGKQVKYRKSSKGGKLLVSSKKPEDYTSNVSETTMDSSECGSDNAFKGNLKKQSKINFVDSLHSTDDSDVDVIVDSQGSFKIKTCRYNRPKCTPKPKVARGPVRQSERIKQLKADKEKSQESTSSDKEAKKRPEVKKRKLSRSARNRIAFGRNDTAKKFKKGS